ncbi:hypothetical protein U0070_015384 [Myodes glareolus]|uniref:Fox-1 C-terminal domain-containing protein n=2 Tax=Muroidea TaxID=337687 RepID=A0AAW0HJ18_MYOGA
MALLLPHGTLVFGDDLAIMSSIYKEGGLVFQDRIVLQEPIISAKIPQGGYAAYRYAQPATATAATAAAAAAAAYSDGRVCTEVATADLPPTEVT